MAIYTRSGDNGQTRLLSGRVVPKDHLRVETYGALDELQALVGMARALCGAGEVAATLKGVQGDLFAVSAELAADGSRRRLKRRIDAGDVARLEACIDRTVQAYGEPSGFVVPGAGTDSAAMHVARAVCRRCERLMVTLLRREGGQAVLLSYINRLGDLLFILAWRLEVKAAVKNALTGIMQQQEGGPSEAHLPSGVYSE